MASLEEIRKIRLEKRKRLEEGGMNPYPADIDFSHTLQEISENFKDGEEVSLVGRVMSIRGQGALLFFNFYDGTGTFQGVLKKDVIGESKFSFFSENVDIGDFLSIKGNLFITKRGQESVEIVEWKMVTKSLRPLPEKWHGLQDTEERYRKRYLDILMNPEVKELFIKKAKFWKVVRDFFEEKQFVEVETPVLESTTGGAEARPFKTHHNDFDIDLYLRISVGELWQKRLIAGGFNKIFEIGKVFRNEGTSAEHLQEFTNLEFYWAFANYEKGMDLVKDLYIKIAQDVFNTTKFKLEKYEFDLADEWKKIDYHDEVLRQTGIDILSATEEEMKGKLKELKVGYAGGENKERLTDTLWKYCRKNIAGPAFLINHPKLIAPLAKSKEGKPEVVDMFQPIIAGSEMGRGYSELNDPVDQKARFDKQQELLKAGDDEAMMLDDEFVEMLEHGMPPTCGFGFGERLFWTLSGVSAREGTLFPLMRPKE
jgi:lysyl-tRNA synthetase, class II